MLKNNRILAIVTTIIILLPIIAGLILWNKLPAEMPTHWDLHGNADNYSGKAFAVFALPLFLAAIHWLGIFAISRDPRNADNNKKLLALPLYIVPFISLLVFTAIYSAALGHTFDFTAIVCSFLGLLFIIIGNYMPKARRNHTVGIRIPWTLKSDVNWERTHRFAAPLWFVGGAITIVLALIDWMLPVTIVFLIMVALPILYSFIYYLKREK